MPLHACLQNLHYSCNSACATAPANTVRISFPPTLAQRARSEHCCQVGTVHRSNAPLFRRSILVTRSCCDPSAISRAVHNARCYERDHRSQFPQFRRGLFICYCSAFLCQPPPGLILSTKLCKLLPELSSPLQRRANLPRRVLYQQMSTRFNSLPQFTE